MLHVSLMKVLVVFDGSLGLLCIYACMYMCVEGMLLYMLRPLHRPTTITLVDLSYPNHMSLLQGALTTLHM